MTRTLLFVSMASSLSVGCELVLGELPVACEDLSACTGPSGENDAGSSTTSAQGGGAGASSGTGGIGGMPTTGGTISTSTGGDTSSSSETAGGGGTTTDTCASACDCDGDDFLAAACGGPDCDDHASEAHPETAEAPVDYHAEQCGNGFDWNCDNQTEIKGGFHKCTLDDCPTGAEFFIGDAPALCGEMGVWGTCKKVSGLLCQKEPKYNTVVACK